MRGLRGSCCALRNTGGSGYSQKQKGSEFHTTTPFWAQMPWMSGFPKKAAERSVARQEEFLKT
jgi:hypothetical protein